MHNSYFSGIRRFLLDNSCVLVQDDSGIPCSFFTPEDWRVRFFGSYPGPIPLFKEYRQPQLAEYFRTTNPAPLDFGIGYRHRVGESILMIASRQPAADPQPEAAATPEPPAPLSASPDRLQTRVHHEVSDHGGFMEICKRLHCR
jgi:hypothetical protein